MLHHVSIGVADLARSAAFYDAVLAPLGHVRFMEKPGTVAWGAGPGPKFWINLREDLTVVSDEGRHVAFRAATNEQFDAFHPAALRAGGVDDGPPGLRPTLPVGSTACGEQVGRCVVISGGAV